VFVDRFVDGFLDVFVDVLVDVLVLVHVLVDVIVDVDVVVNVVGFSFWLWLCRVTALNKCRQSVAGDVERLHISWIASSICSGVVCMHCGAP
jgi:hypothetical protein